MDLFDTGYDWLDLIIVISIFIIWYFIIFKPWREPPKDGNKVVGIFSKAGGRRGIYTKKQQEFNIKMMLWGGLSSATTFGLALFAEWLRFG